MSINIFQFLKQGTSLSRQSMQLNKQLEQKVTPKQHKPNALFFQTGRFHESENIPTEGGNNNQWEQLDEQKMKHMHNKQVQEANLLRKKSKIKVEGTDVSFPARTFAELISRYQLNREIVANLARRGYEVPTAVQMQTLPLLLEDRNVLVTAPTGTGKTLSFLVPVLQNILKKRRENQLQVSKPHKKNKSKPKTPDSKTYSKIEAIIISPQHELSRQILNQLSTLVPNHGSCQPIERVTYRCISQLDQSDKANLHQHRQAGINILISTPQLFLNLFQKIEDQHEIFAQTKYIILDQCDKYFEESFLQQIRSMLEIFNTIRPKPVYGLFSATIQHPVEELLRGQLLDDAVRVQVGGKNRVLSSIDQSIEYCTNEYGKLLELKNMIAENRFIPPALIFVQEKTRAKQLLFEVKKMMKSGPGGMDISKKIELLSSDKSKQQREQILAKFQKGSLWVLITTDLVARGIDFTHVNLVINYDFPNTMLTYIHRVGRTGRASRQGKAVTFFTEEDKPIVRSLADLLVSSGCNVPAWILEMPKADRKLKKKLEKYPTRRLPVGVAEAKDKNFEVELEKMEKIWQRKKERAEEKEKKKKEGQQSEESEWIQA